MSKFFNCLFGLTIFVFTLFCLTTPALAVAPPTPIIDSIVGDTSTPATDNDSTPDVVISNLNIGDDIRVFSGGTEVGSIIAVGDTQVTITTSVLDEGAHTITAIAYEVGTGDASLASTDFVYNLDLTPPSVPSIVSIAGSTQTSITSNDQTPDVVISGLTIGDTVKVYAGGTEVGSSVSVGETTVTITTSSLSESAHTFTVRATDQVGNESSDSVSFTYTVDITAPAVPSIVSIAGSTQTSTTSNDQTPDVIISGLTIGDTVKVYAGGTLVATSADIGATTVTLTSSILPEGTNTITATASDIYGNESVASVSFEYILDTIAPAVPSIVSIAGSTASPTTFNDSTPDVIISGLTIGDTVKVYAGGTEVGSSVSVGATTVTITTSALSESTHSITVRSSDTVGNESTDSAAFLYTYDITPPSIPAIVSIAGGTSPYTSNDSTPDVIISGLTIGDTVKVYAGGTEVGSSVSVGATAVTVTTSSLSEATHSITVKATDIAGNESADSSVFSYTVDITPPSIPAIVSIAGGTSPYTSNDSTPDVIISGLTIGDTVKVYAGGTLVATSADIGATTVTLTSSTLPEGTSVITATASDRYGNESSASTSFDYILDSTPPAAPSIVSIIGSTASPVFGNDQTPDVVISGLTIGDTVKVYAGGTEVGSSVSVGATTVTITTSSLPIGSNSITATSTDTIGNTSAASGAITYNIDITSPTVVISSGATNPTNTSPIPLTITFSKAVVGFNSSMITIGNGVTESLNTSDNTVFTMNVVPSADGLVTADIGSTVVSDQYGNGNTAATQFTITYDSISPSAPNIVSVGGGTSSPYTGTDSTPDVVLSGLTIGETIRVYSGGTQVASQTNIGATSVTVTTSTLLDGSNSITAMAFDSAGNSSVGSTAFVYNLDSSIPTVVISAGVSNPTNTSPIPITVTFSEAVTGFSSDDIVVGNGTTGVLTTSDNTVFQFNLTPSANGLVTVDVGSTVAQDASGNGNTAATQFAITYDNIAPSAPTIYSVAGILVSPGSNNDTTPDVVLRNITIGDTVKVYVGGTEVVTQSAVGATSVTLTIPTLATGSHTLTARSIDPAGNTSSDSSSFIYTVDPGMPNQPVIDSIDSSTISPVTSNDSTPSVVLSNLTIGDSVKVYAGGTEVANITGIGDTRVTVSTSTLAEGTYSITAIAYAAGTGNASNPSIAFNLTINLSGPGVTKLGNGSADYILSSGTTAALVFNRAIGPSGKSAVENAISAGADNIPSYSWTGSDTTLILTAGSSNSVFANDVTANVSDQFGNTTLNLLLIDSVLSSNQIDAAPSVTVDANQNQVVITGSAGTVITVPSGVTNATINIDSLLSGNSATLPSISVNTATSIGSVSVAIPTQTVVTSGSAWNGIINVPTIRENNSVTVTPETGRTANISSVIEIGAEDVNLTFDKAVRISIAGQGNKSAGFYRNGSFTQITNACSSDTQEYGDALAAGSECGMTVGSDMVIWTKHFTRFIAYSQSIINDGHSNNNNNNSGPSGPPGAPSCGNQMPGGTPQLFRIERINKKTVKLHFTPTSGPNTYYYIAYGKTAGSETYGVTFEMGDYPGEVTYIVGNLASNANYYFKVRGGNGCMPGVWSNNLSIKEKYMKSTKPAPVKKAVKKATTRTTSPIKQ